MAEKTVTGILHSITDGSFYFETDDGQTIILVFDAEHRTPIQRKIALSIYSGDDGKWHVNPTGKYFSLILEALCPPQVGCPGGRPYAAYRLHSGFSHVLQARHG
jgi:hypothetical protein